MSGQLIRHPVTSDVHPRFEYLAGRSRHEEKRDFRNWVWPKWTDRLAASLDVEGPFPEALPAARSGRDLVRLNALERAASRSEHGVEIQMLRDRVPAELISIPDPSAFEMQPAD